MTKKVKVGLLGLGVVGGELASIINTNKENILNKYNLEIEIGKVFVRDLSKKRSVDIDTSKFTTDAYEVLRECDIICECMGGAGTETAKEYVMYAVKAKKPVIMSSKKVLARYGKDILDLCLLNETQLRFDATVGGGIPIAKVIKECFKGEEIVKAVGILNATSNFIYTNMEKNGCSFEEALKKAQELGYAENDPSEDIHGHDALYKVIVLALFAMKKWIDIDKIIPKTFSSINVLDMKYANELGYKIKPLAIFEKRRNKFIYRVGPCLIDKDNMAANVVNNFNIIALEGSNSGLLGFYGQGAGSKPTASAMFDDLINALNSSFEQDKDLYEGCESAEEYIDYNNNLYWRISVENTTGKLAKVCTVLAENSVNIEKLIQKDEINGKIGVVLLTRCVDLTSISNITKEFENNDIEINTIIPFFNN